MSQTPDQFADKLGSAFDARKLRLMQRVVLAVEGEVKQVTPVRTGTLRRSITSRVEKGGDRGIVGTSVIYARVVNTRSRYLERGLENAQPTIGRLLEEEGAALWGDVS